jgi:putative heme-binding domain-containing protein
VVFGTHAKFPARYQHAMFTLDWTFGTIRTVHFTPKGSTYVGEKEEFLSGSPLAVTDAVFGPDGAFYFTVGGRGSQSALYRVTYVGTESTDPSPVQESQDTIKARALRHSLEAFHGRRDPKAVDTAWKYLDDDDRFMRFAARLAIEAQPVSEWQERALDERNPQAAADALIALARQGDKSVQEDLLKALGRFNLDSMSETPRLGLLRAYALCFARMGRPDQDTIDTVIAELDPLLPAQDENTNTELCRLLIYLDAPGIVDKGMALLANAPDPEIPDWARVIKRNQDYGGTIRAMLDNHPPSPKIKYAFMLRNVSYGWTMKERQDYFNFINEAAKYPGGASYAGFLKNIRDEALANCSEAEKVALAPITGQSLEAGPPFEVKKTKGASKPWTLSRAKAAVRKGLHSRNYEDGRNGFYAAGCVKCHRFDGAGGAVGPDLSTVSNKFSLNDLLTAILDPSRDISDQYGSKMVTTKDGELYDGIVIDHSGSQEEGEIQIYTSDLNAKPVVVKSADIESIEDSKVSQMPEGLIDVLDKDELLDLLAYLMSRGDPDDKVFK